MAKSNDCGHDTLEVRSVCADCGQELGRAEVSRAQATRRGLSPEELAAEGGTDLPGREAMSLVNLNLAAPINLAAALNVLSDGSIAYADAAQTTPIDQSN